MFPVRQLVQRNGRIVTDDQVGAYIDACLVETGADVEALAGRQGIGRWEITDEWREW